MALTFGDSVCVTASLITRGGEVYLFSADGAGNLTGYVQGYHFGASLSGVGFGRYTNSQGRIFFVSQQSNTLLGPNSGPQVSPVVITEIMYAPRDVFVNGAFWNNTEHEFIELYNVSGQPMTLNGTTNTWRLDGAIEYEFPPDTTLSTAERVLMVSFDPADAAAAGNFRSTYGLGGTPRLFGPYKGNLSNSGESIRLIQPDVIRLSETSKVVTAVWMDEVEYSDSSPWPVAADGIGFSLQKTMATHFGNDPINWVAAAPTPGTSFAPGPAPIINQQPINLTGIAGRQALLRVVVSGTGPFSYQWRFNGNNLADATNSILTIENVQLNHAGQYQVVVMSPANSVASDLATITVVFPATIAEQPQGSSVTPGADVILRVAAVSTTPITYQWFKNDFPISGATSALLNLPNIQPNDSGVYQTRVSDAVADIFSVPARVVVLVEPIIVTQPVGLTNLVGSTAVFSVGLTNGATLPIGYRWRKGGVTVATRVLNTRTDFLILQNIQTTDVGSYNVVVTNAASSQPLTSMQARLGVVITGLDDDHDSIPNDWERAYNLDPNNPNDATQDSDGDGYLNRDEYIAGTDPQNPASYLQVETISATGGAIVTFRAEAGRTYSVQYRDALAGSIWTILEGVPSLPSSRLVTVRDPNSVIGQRFYRLVAPGIPVSE